MAHSRPDCTDEMLLKAICNNDVRAFEALFERYAERLYNFALRYVQDPAIAEELMMDVMHWVWMRRERLDNIKQAASYLSKAIRNKVFDHLRKTTIDTLPLDALPERGNQLVDPTPTNHSLDLAELRESYERTLQSLPAQCKKVFELSRENELSHAEISSILNISVKTVEGHITNALKIMRRNLPSSTGVACSLFLLLLP
ncbi:RNA polymerase sigma-70 factor [Parapedobacter sp. ISTM3]|uniref:RNA polymerase sigma-70 factor n=1 Tax=Parapedobacter sp. ISTM3 TaxID=2800130 RepID=UPI0019057391|nr:RNA polymerase sigma-70 factor [Parapedobacter sp. ISTM3]MBK1441498.1 RNA polymerase sigma-70 factor [Parapedobacter sp. ISTM3]